MSDTVVIGIDSNLIPSDKKNRLKYASKYYNGSFRNSSKKNKPGINAGNLDRKTSCRERVCQYV